MCGLVGMMGPGVNTWDLKVLGDLALVCSLRGTDATGILQGKATSWFGKDELEYFVEKTASDSSFFKWYHARHPEGNKRVMDRITDNFFCIHTRDASKGALTDENAHPFEFENIVGMHNGTLRTHKYHDDVKTDSELLFKDINDNGLLPVLKELNPGDAYALVILNKKDHTISFVRNEERPLFYCFHETRRVMYWASEKWMLLAMMGRNGEKILNGEVYFFKPGLVHTLHPEDIETKKNFPFKTEEVPAKVYSPQKGNKFHNRNDIQAKKNAERIMQAFRQQQQRNKTPGIKKNNKVVPIRADKPVFNSRTRVPSYFCCSCYKKLNLVEVHYATKVGSNTYMCEECSIEHESNPIFNMNREVQVH